jgi:hypothetical protein
MGDYYGHASAEASPPKAAPAGAGLDQGRILLARTIVDAEINPRPFSLSLFLSFVRKNICGRFVLADDRRILTMAL